jgi:transcriptional regulator with XRE-family HTH domain
MGDKSPMPRKRHTARKRTDRNSVGKAVQQLRRQQDLTQEDLAGRAAAVGWNISRDVVKRIERGEREITDIELRLLAKALRVPPAVLLG